MSSPNVSALATKAKYFELRGILGTIDNTVCGKVKSPVSYVLERLQRNSVINAVNLLSIEIGENQGAPHDPIYVSTIHLSLELADKLGYPQATSTWNQTKFTSNDPSVEPFYDVLGVSRKQGELGGFKKKDHSKVTAVMSLIIELQRLDRQAQSVWTLFAASLNQFKSCHENSITLHDIKYKTYCEGGNYVHIPACELGPEGIKTLFHLCSMIGLCMDVEGQDSELLIVARPIGLFDSLCNWSKISSMYETDGAHGQRRWGGYSTKSHPRFEYTSLLSSFNEGEHRDRKDFSIDDSLDRVNKLPTPRPLGVDHEIIEVVCVPSLERCRDTLLHCLEVSFDLEWGHRWPRGGFFEQQNMSAFIQLLGYEEGRATKTFIVHLLIPDVRSNFRDLIGIPIFSNVDIVKTGHSTAVGDLPILMKDLGVIVCNLFDTQEADKVVMANQKCEPNCKPIGLIPLLLKYKIIGQNDANDFADLKKRYQDSNWTEVSSELDPERVRYLEMDVRFLAQLRSTMMVGLDEDSLRAILGKTRSITDKVQSSLATDDRLNAGKEMTDMYRDFATDAYEVGYVWNEIAESHYRKLLECRYILAKEGEMCLTEVAPTSLLVCLAMHAAANAEEVSQSRHSNVAEGGLQYFAELVQALDLGKKA